ncbi:MAG: hypothetical protein OEM49_05680 [Myxococcales bacterium]|nr:hypothetical protein [Myxococcales bacterium]MDH5307464.1 hypothetical protein [Myxococcales bacterium]MDH5566926.1 hypothetical protein [Myxococcales bacterium]
MTAAEQVAFRRRVEAAIRRDDPRELADVALEIALESTEREWAQSCCVQLARHRDPCVRGSALVGLGHLARRFGQLDPQRVKRVVENGLWDRNEHVQRQAQSAADDLATFLRWEFEGPSG